MGGGTLEGSKSRSGITGLVSFWDFAGLVDDVDEDGLVTGLVAELKKSSVGLEGEITADFLAALDGGRLLACIFARSLNYIEWYSNSETRIGI